MNLTKLELIKKRLRAQLGIGEVTNVHRAGARPSAGNKRPLEVDREGNVRVNMENDQVRRVLRRRLSKLREQHTQAESA